MHIENLNPIAISIGVAIITIAVIAMMIPEFVANSYSSETKNLTFYNATTLTTIQAGVTSYHVYNDTIRTNELPGTNFSVYTNNGTVLLLDNNIKNQAGPREIVWTIRSYTNATNVFNKGSDAMQAFAGWFNIIIIAVVAVVVLGLIMMLDRQQTTT